MPKGYTFRTQEERELAKQQSQFRYYDSNVERIAKKPRSNEKLRLAIITLLGEECKGCGFSDIRALQIDHIKGGGSQEQKTIGYYFMLKQILEQLRNGQGFEDYQVLCANCNMIKRLENKECIGSGRPRLPRTNSDN